MTKEYIREEEDGSITKTYAIEDKGVLKTHNNKGPAIVNTEKKIKEYYLFGVKLTKDKWEVRKKLS